MTASPLPGPAGNVEYFLWLRAGAPPPEIPPPAKAATTTVNPTHRIAMIVAVMEQVRMWITEMNTPKPMQTELQRNVLQILVK